MITAVIQSLGDAKKSLLGGNEEIVSLQKHGLAVCVEMTAGGPFSAILDP